MRHLRTAESEYRAFPNLRIKNATQELFEVPALVRLLDLPQGRRLLEVGCGRGVALPALWRLCAPSRLVGLDVDPELLEEAERAACRLEVPVELVEGDVRRLPFGDGSFDLVVDFGTCYHVAAPERALAEIARVLSPGGMFVQETPVSQLLAHPLRSRGRRLPWAAADPLVCRRRALLWSAREKPLGAAAQL